jgi:hypothetical protein
MKIETTSKACNVCAHWNSESAETGECRRHAPQNIVFKVNEQVSVKSQFPNTAKSDWCGDFESK